MPERGGVLKFLSVVDEFTRECFVEGVTQRYQREYRHSSESFAMRVVPAASNNRPEFITQAIERWLAQLRIETMYIAPGSPWQNGYVESFHSKLRDEF